MYYKREYRFKGYYLNLQNMRYIRKYLHKKYKNSHSSGQRFYTTFKRSIPYTNYTTSNIYSIKLCVRRQLHSSKSRCVTFDTLFIKMYLIYSACKTIYNDDLPSLDHIMSRLYVYSYKIIKKTAQSNVQFEYGFNAPNECVI